MKQPFSDPKMPVSFIAQCNGCGTSFTEAYEFAKVYKSEVLSCPECNCKELKFRFVLKGEDKNAQNGA